MSYDITKLGQLNTIIEPCEVLSIPAGAIPKSVIVQQPGGDGAAISVWWSGTPTLAVGDLVAIQRRTVAGGQYMVIGVSGATADEEGGGWPDAGQAMINNTEYNTIPDAITASASGDIIKIGQGTHTGQALISSQSNRSLRGLSPRQTILTRSDDTSNTVQITNSTDVAVEDVKITNTGAGSASYGLQLTQVATDSNGLILDNVIVEKTSGAPTTAAGIVLQGGTAGGSLLRHCKSTVSAGTNKYAILVDSVGAQVVVEGGEYNGDTADIRINHSSAVVELRGPKLLGGGISVAAGTVKGWYINSSGHIVIVGATDFLGLGSNFPDIGSTTLAQKFGNVYLGTAKDLFADDDDFALFNRLINYGYTPDEHWRGGAEVLSWTGWAAYTGWVTPSSLTISASQYIIAHNAAAKAFRYRSAATGDNIYLRARVSPGTLVGVGVMLDDGVNNADGNGANNFYSINLAQTTAAGNPIIVVVQSRTGGGAVTTTTSAFELDWTMFHGIGLNTSGTLWTSWNANARVFGEGGELKGAVAATTGLTWTPARMGITFSNGGGGALPLGRVGRFDWYDEATA